MPLEILAPLVVFGIAFAVLLVRLLVNAPSLLLQDEATVLQTFALDYPTAISGDGMIIAKDQKVAVIPLKEPADHVGLVEVMGSKHLTRLLGKDDISAIEAKADNEIVLSLNDFTLPKISVMLESPEAVRAFKGKLEPLTS